MKVIQKNIKLLEIVIKSKDEINPTDMSDSLDNALTEAKKQYDELIKEHGEPKVRKRTKKQ